MFAAFLTCAILHFYIKDLKEDDRISIEIKEKDGSLIKRYNNKAKLNNLNPEADLPLVLKSGGNKLIWDMRYPGYKEFEGMVFYSSPNKGPKAVPGEYLISLNYNGEVIEQSLKIEKDPRLENTDNDFTTSTWQSALRKIDRSIDQDNQKITNQKDKDFLNAWSNRNYMTQGKWEMFLSLALMCKHADAVGHDIRIIPKRYQDFNTNNLSKLNTVSYTHLTLPTICSV